MISFNEIRDAAWARLPFVSVHERGDEAATISFWSVVDDGDYTTNCAVGREHASAAIEYFASYDDPSLLPRVIAEMPRDLGGVEIGFLTALAQRYS